MQALTVTDLCGILKIGKNQAYALMNSKAFPSYRIGNKLYVTDDALAEWLKKIQGKNVVI